MNIGDSGRGGKKGADQGNTDEAMEEWRCFNVCRSHFQDGDYLINETDELRHAAILVIDGAITSGPFCINGQVAINSQTLP